MRLLVAISLAHAVSCCSNFMMPNAPITGRTMDEPVTAEQSAQWAVATQPVGSTLNPQAGRVRTSKFGLVGFFHHGTDSPKMDDFGHVAGGMNEMGLTCDVLALVATRYPAPTNTSADVNVWYFCQWALSNYATAADVRLALTNGSAHVWGGAADYGIHHVLRDASGAGLVVEYIEGEAITYADPNDGKTGFGLLTNDPEYPFMVRLVQHFESKRGRARTAAATPGNFYADERLLRLHTVKSGMAPPTSNREAIMQAVHVLNTVTVPMGPKMIGTPSRDTNPGPDHTEWGVIYDHGERVIYWRTLSNQNLQRVRLEDVDLGQGAKRVLLPLAPTDKLPWYNDAAADFGPA